MPALRQPERVVVTGAGGQLGQALLSTVPEGATAIGLARADLDISDPASIDACLDREAPQLLINAAAYTAVDRAEDDRDNAYRINAEAPGLLARACTARGIRFFHVSTDFVFDGAKSRPYEPADAPGPLGVYGASKLAGEEAVAEALPAALILRTGWVYSSGPANFLNTMLRLHSERDELRVVADQVGTPTAAHSLAGALWAAAQRPDVTGIYHYSDAGACSWYDFAVAIGEEAVAAGLITEAARVLPIATEEYPTPAARPAYSVLDKSATWRDLDLAPVHWRTRLRETIDELKSSPDA
jgi:dTDP-4-dehydrorhamnose reductase